jgi:t-SNARE complex subunit (syntaxin)
LSIKNKDRFLSDDAISLYMTDEDEDRTQINVRVTDEQKDKFEEYIEREDTGQNTISDLVRTATIQYVSESQTSDTIDEIDAVATQLTRIEQSITDMSRTMQEMQDSQLESDEVKDSVDSTVRKLLYDTLIGNENVEGIQLKE